MDLLLPRLGESPSNRICYASAVAMLESSRELLLDGEQIREFEIVGETSAVALAERLARERGVSALRVPVPDRPVASAHRLPHPAASGPAMRAVAYSLQHSNTPDFSVMQQYLYRAPFGVDAAAARVRRGVSGSGVRVLDIEGGWNLEHEDLCGAGLRIVYGSDNGVSEHGTAVLGILGASDDGCGVRGICSGAEVMCASDERDGVWILERTIRDASRNLSAGDVILVESQIRSPLSAGVGTEGTFGDVPAEYFPAVFAAIREAVDRGIYVVEAAGNGAISLDHPQLEGRFEREQQDSGAIVVGAGSSGLRGAARMRLSFSNHGRRVDVQAWGEHVVATGGLREGAKFREYADLQYVPSHPERCYTSSFSGTSSATAIVAGVVALASACVKATGRHPVAPLDLRAALVATGTPQMAPERGHIGPLPNLAALLDMLGV